MRKVMRIGSKRKPKITEREMALTSKLKAKVELSQTLIPIGLGAVAEELRQEVEQPARGITWALPLGESRGIDLSMIRN